MLTISNLSVQFGKRILFDEVNTSFTQGNCYGIIGANGAGKSTFLKIIAGELDPTSGRVILEPGKRMSVLNQNHNMFDEYTVLDTVLIGNKTLHALKSEMDALYADYDDKNADRIGELQLQFDEMNGWNAESDAASLLSNLEIGLKTILNLSYGKKIVIIKNNIIFDSFEEFVFKNSPPYIINKYLFKQQSKY